MLKKLQFKVGHKKDQFFAVESTDDKQSIRQVFYNRDKCLQYIYKENKEREYEINHARPKHTHKRNS